MKRLLAVALVLFWATMASAEKRVALVFGADRYETIRPLANAVNDARAMEETLAALDFEVFSETNRDLRRMRRALEDFEEDAAGADVALIFFAGHGVEIAGENRLLPTDADASSLEALTATSLALNDVQAMAARVAKSALIVLDACRNDPFATLSDPNGRGAFALSLPDTVKPGLGRVGSAEKTLFAFSAAPGETASDGNDGNSPFTTALTKYLATEGLEIRSVLTLVQQEVYDRTGGRQLPYVESGLPRLFFASSKTATLPERERLLLAMADLDPTTRLDVERIAAEAGVPLAPLFGTLIGSDLAKLDREQRRSKLREAARAFTRVRDELRLLRSGDARVTQLRQEAEAQLSLGAFEAARAKLTAAAQIDANSRETLKANLIERTLSEAATHYLNGGAAQAELRYDLARADHTRAVRLFEEVAPGTMPKDGRQQHLNALQALGFIAFTTGSLPQAAEAYEKQLAVARDAVGFAADDADLQYILALAHDNLGDVVFEQGQIDKALVHYRDAHAVRLRLAEQYPEDAEVSFALSNSYHRLGQIYQRQGDLNAAERYYEEKYQLGKEMVATGIEDLRWQRDLSLSDERLGDILRQRGNLDAALARYASSLDRMIPLRDANPQNLELRRFTSITLDRMGEIFAAQGALAQALEKFETARDLRLELVAADAANFDWQYVLGISHERIGDLLSRQGDIAGATRAYEQKHQIASLLAEADPTNVRWLRDLSVADERLGTLARNRGEQDTAIAYYQSSLARMTGVRERSPSDMELTRFVSFTQDLIAHVLTDQEKFDDALTLYEKSRALREGLVQIDPKNPDWRFILGVSYELIGNVHMRAGRPDRAVEPYAQELKTMSVLLAQDPENQRWSRAVSVTNELLGDAYWENGELDKAIEQFQFSLQRMSAVRDANPETLSWQRFTAVTLRKIGAAYLEKDAPADALAAYSESATLSGKLIAAEPQNVRWLRDVIYAQRGVARAGGNAQQALKAAEVAARALATGGNLSLSDEEAFAELVARAGGPEQ